LTFVEALFFDVLLKTVIGHRPGAFLSTILPSLAHG
jgi:hypothetical protein